MNDKHVIKYVEESLTNWVDGKHPLALGMMARRVAENAKEDR